MIEKQKWSLIVKIPLPKGISFSTPRSVITPATPVAPSAAALPKYNRHFWFRCSRSGSTLPIADLLRTIGIRHASERVRFGGTAKFGTDDFTLLVKAVRDVAAILPDNMNQLIDISEDAESLKKETAALLDRFGASIWGFAKTRPWLLKASDGVEAYPRDLMFENKDDEALLTHYIRTWILLKAFNSTRNGTHIRAAQKKKKRGSKSIGTVTSSDQSIVSSDAASRYGFRASKLHSRKRQIYAINEDSESDMNILHDDRACRRGPQREAKGNLNSKFRFCDDLAMSDDDGRDGPEQSAATSSRDSAVTTQQTQPKAATPTNTEGVGCITTTLTPDTDVDIAGDGNPAPLLSNRSHTPTETVARFTLHVPSDSPERIFRDKSPDIPAVPTTPPASNSDMTKKGFPLNGYWSEASWRRFIIYNHVNMPTIIACLGLACRRVLHVGLVLDHTAGTALQVAVGRIATKLTEELVIDEMPEYAADPNYLNEEIDELFGEFAARLWGQDSNRRLLMTPGTDIAYPKHLVYENDGDRKLLWIHLHRWIFASAFALLRPDKPNSRIPFKASSSRNPKVAFSHGDKSDGGRNGGVHTSTVAPEDTQKHGEKRGRHMVTSKIEDAIPQAKRPKTDEFTDVPLPTRKTQATTPNVARLCRRILAYLEAYGKLELNEQLALEGMEKEYNIIAPFLHGHLIPSSFPVVFKSWLDYRYTILAIKMEAAATQRQKLSDMDTKIKNIRLVNALRTARDKFMTSSDEVVSADLIMCLGIAGLSKAGGEYNMLVEKVKYQLAMLDAHLTELAKEIDTLRGGEWITMG